MPYFNQDHNPATRRLARLIEQRLQNRSDSDRIDAEIWDTFGEEHAIMFTDLSGFSRGAEKFGIMHFLQIIYESEQMFTEIISQHDGRIIKVEADSMLVIFPNPERSVSCAIAMQRECGVRNVNKLPEEKILLCVGLGFGRIINLDYADVYGAEVNAASKLGEDIAKRNEILVTDSVKAFLDTAGGFATEPIDEVPSGAKAAFRLLWK